MHIVVVGGGIAGASTAYHLARAGAEVTIVDSKAKGQATAAGAGIISPWLSKRVRIKPYFRLAKAGAIYYPELLELLKEDGQNNVSYKQVGALYVSASKKRLDELEKLAYKQRVETPEIGEIRRLSTEEARVKFPPLREDMTALFLEGAARVDGRQLLQALLDAGEARGVRYVQGEASLLHEGSKVTGVCVDEETIEADTVVAAAGAWINKLLEPVSIKLPVEPQKGQIMHMHVNADTSNWPVILPKSSHYLLGFDGGKVVAGATREVGSGYDTKLTAAGMQEVVREALKVAPGLADEEVTEFRVGLRPAGPNPYPILGPVKNVDGLHLAAGFGPAGLNLAPYSGKLVAEVILGRTQDLDITPYLL
ncbi:NAD(P)/FAD-dependent oxidoreductase [Terribacillus sp. JSM ZJ617]|uniref:NAD(P)/FAD-dependent oxidoreductase n=1 Tax=Terribacillus sp. JSM ZJ617 TaxID=3342119 RepID=UPI0035A9835C